MKSTSPAYFVSSSAYDQRLDQFLSADPLVQDPTNSQNYNHYAYCFNNPLKYTDPSGYRISGNNNYWGQDGDYSSNMNYYIDGVRVSPSEYRAYGGARTTEFHGNINWSGPGGEYYMVDFQRIESSSMVAIAIQYTYKETVNDIASWGQTEGTSRTIERTGYTYMTFQKPMGNQFTSNVNEYISRNGQTNCPDITTSYEKKIVSNQFLTLTQSSSTTFNGNSFYNININQKGNIESVSTKGISTLTFGLNGCKFGMGPFSFGLKSNLDLTFGVNIPMGDGVKSGYNLTIDRKIPLAADGIVVGGALLYFAPEFLVPLSAGYNSLKPAIY